MYKIQSLNVGDPIELLRHLFLGVDRIPCDTGDARQRVLDVNGDGAADVSDAIDLLNHLFGSGRAPALGTDCVPFEGCLDACAETP